VSIRVSASDDFGVTSVTLRVDGSELATETQADDNGAFVFSWDSTSASDGRHSLTAEAVDGSGNVGKSSIPVDVANSAADTVPPQAVVSSPNDGDVVSKTVTLSGFGQDDQSMAQFSLKVNGRLMCTGTSSASCGWNTRKEKDGTYTIAAESTDLAGNTGTSSISVTIGGGTSDSTDDSSTDSGPPPGRGWRK
jgi:hypothetical protein